MAEYDVNFASTLKIAWDNFLKSHDRLIFVVCGSVSMWIKENIIESKAFFGRRSLDLVVPELPLRECVRFWGERLDRTPIGDIVDFISVTGGVPKYLEELNPSLSANENIRRLAFEPNAVLRMDFDEMFTDVIRRQPKFAGRALRALMDGPKTISEIALKLGVKRGGDLSEAMAQLVEAGLVARQGGENPMTGVSTRMARYRIRDNYSRFYLRYLEPAKAMIDEGAFAFHELDQFKGWQIDRGYQFENLVLNNFREILKPLHLEKSLVKSAAPYVRRGSEKTGRKGVPVDLLIQTNMSLCIVEVKRQKQIGPEVIAAVQEKCRRVPHGRDVALRTALVYEGDLAPSVEAEGYFDAIVPFHRLLGL